MKLVAKYQDKIEKRIHNIAEQLHKIENSFAIISILKF